MMQKLLASALLATALTTSTALAGPSYNQPMLVDAIIAAAPDMLARGSSEEMRARKLYLIAFTVDLYNACQFYRNVKAAETLGRMYGMETRDGRELSLPAVFGEEDAEFFRSRHGCGSGEATKARQVLDALWQPFIDLSDEAWAALRASAEKRGAPKAADRLEIVRGRNPFD